MKKLWIGILVIAIIGLIAIFAYKPADTSMQSSDQGSGSMKGNQSQTGSGGSMNNNSSSSGGGNPSSGVTASELATHNNKNDCWVAYKGKVYDITDFLPVHPGSSAAIEPYCGTSTEFENAFTMKHGTSKVGVLESRGIFEGNLV